MKRKADLFYLIKAMSKSEKRYFTLDAQKSGRKDARYLELFQAINDQETYDEALLKEKFGKNLPTDKTYLYEAILRSMRDYRSANSYAARIKEMIMDAKYLYERGLYEQSEERFVSATELAEEIGDQLSIIELNKEYRRLINFTKKKGYEQKLMRLISQKDKNLQDLREELYFLDLLDKIIIEVRKKPQRLEQHEQEIVKQQFRQLLDNQIKEPDSIQGKLRFFQCMGLLYQLLGNRDQTYNYFKKIVDCWDENVKFKQEEFFRYILDVANLLSITFSDPTKSDSLPILLNKLETEQPTHFHDKKALFEQITTYRLIYAINSGDFHNIQLLINRIDKGLKQFNLAYNSEIVMIFNVSILLFMAHDYTNCKIWSDRIILKGDISVRQDIHYSIRIIYLVATLETKDFDEIELVIRNTARYFNKTKIGNDGFSNILLKFAKDIHRSGTAEENKILIKFKENIIAAKERKIVVPLGIDELLLYWIESKIHNRSISSLIKSAS